MKDASLVVLCLGEPVGASAVSVSKSERAAVSVLLAYIRFGVAVGVFVGRWVRVDAAVSMGEWAVSG